MEHSFFSVIVPVCRCGKYAECLVKSLLRQSFGDFEALILDDGSGDGTLDAYRRQAGGEKRFRFFELEHGGTASRLRNAGIRLAQGRYLIFLDGDDWLETDALERIAARLKELDFPDVLAIGLREAVEQPDGSLCDGASAANFPFLVGAVSGCEALALAGRHGVEFKGYSPLNVTAGKFIVEQELFQCEDILILEDSEWGLRLYLSARRVGALDGVCYRYRRHSGSATRGNSGRTLPDAALALRRMTDFCLPRLAQMSPDARIFCAKHITGHFFTFFFYPAMVAKSDPALRRKAFLDCIGPQKRFRSYCRISRHAPLMRRLVLPLLWLGRLPGMMFVPTCFFRYVYYPLALRRGGKA